MTDDALRTICVNKDDWSETTYRFVVDYTMNEDVMFYAGMAGYTETCSTTYSCAYPYDPETNTISNLV